MTEVESRVVHVRIEPEEAIENKRKLLEMQVNMLNIFKRYYNFKALNRQEGKSRQLIRRIVNEVDREFDAITNMLPKEEEGAKPLLKVKRGKLLGAEEESQAVAKKETATSKIELELKELQERIAKLS
ncbi:hypothetical protein HZA33_04675 [Candidatus Pacearchaeota archaeon]|nr:hypothetical protein [Candidatus Pacearchaeota archaeon]